MARGVDADRLLGHERSHAAEQPFVPFERHERRAGLAQHRIGHDRQDAPPGAQGLADRGHRDLREREREIDHAGTYASEA